MAMENQATVTVAYPPGAPDDLVITWVRSDLRKTHINSIMHDKLGHILNRRQCALYLALYLDHLPTFLEVEKCYAIFCYAVLKSNYQDTAEDDGRFQLGYINSSKYYTNNPGLLFDNRIAVIEDIFESMVDGSDVTFVCGDLSLQSYIVNPVEFNLRRLLEDNVALKTFLDFWRSVPDMHQIRRTLRQFDLPHPIIDIILIMAFTPKAEQFEIYRNINTTPTFDQFWASINAADDF